MNDEMHAIAAMTAVGAAAYALDLNIILPGLVIVVLGIMIGYRAIKRAATKRGNR